MQETVTFHKANGDKGNGAIVLKPEGFGILESWLNVTEQHLRTSVGYLGELICEDFGRRKGIPNLRVADYSLYVEEFDDKAFLSWRYRLSGIVGDGTYLIDYQVYDGKYELGDSERRLAEGSIRLKPKSIKATP